MTQDSKKLNCPAVAKIVEVLAFPSLKVSMHNHTVQMVSALSAYKGTGNAFFSYSVHLMLYHVTGSEMTNSLDSLHDILYVCYFTMETM